MSGTGVPVGMVVGGPYGFTNTHEVLDYMATRYGANDSDTRDLLLAFYKLAVADVWNADDWWFKREDVPFSFVAATPKYTMVAATENVVELYDVNGAQLDFITPLTFNGSYRAHSVITGTPQVWTVATREQTTGALELLVWPTPDANTTGRMVRKVRDVVLVDLVTNRSRIPQEYMHVPVYLAMANLASRGSQAEERSTSYDQDFQRALAEMKADNQRRKQGIIT